MSTILKALRRLEEEKEHQAVEDRLHGEVVAPVAPSPPSRIRPLLVLLIAAVLSVALGASVVLLLPGWLERSAGTESVDVAAAEAAVRDSQGPVDALRQAEERAQPTLPPRSAPRRTAARSPRDPAAQAPTGRVERTAANRSAPVPNPSSTSRHVAAPPPTEAERPGARGLGSSVAVFERAKPPPTETSRQSPASPPPTPQRVAQLDMVRPIDDLPRHTPSPAEVEPPPQPRAAPAPEPKAAPSPQPKKKAKAAPAPKAPKQSGVDRIARARVPDVEVLSTVWHPNASRRVARLSIDGEAIELHEGDTIKGLVVKEIKLSGVTLQHDDVTISRRVGKAR